MQKRGCPQHLLCFPVTLPDDLGQTSDLSGVMALMSPLIPHLLAEDMREYEGFFFCLFVLYMYLLWGHLCASAGMTT